MISYKMSAQSLLSRDTELTLPDFSTPVHDGQVKRGYGHQQYVNPNCYGKGKRRSELKPPNIPKSCLHLLRGKGTKSDDAAIILKGAQGRGRGMYSNESTTNTLNNSAQLVTTPGRDGEQGNEIINRREKLSDVFELERCQSEHRGSPLPALTVSWTLHPPHVCQIDGLPTNFEQDVLEDVISFYSAISGKEERRHDGGLSIRYRLSSFHACDLLASSINDTDLFGTGCVVTCRHLTS